MHIIEDSRQKPDKHTVKNDWWKTHGDILLRCKLPFGDYALPPKVSIDTKEGMQEIAQNIGGTKTEHNRFREECKLAKEFGCHLYFLIENNDGIMDLRQVEGWQNPRREFSPNAINGRQLFRAMSTMQERYGCTFLFCHPDDTALIIKNILERGV